MVCSHFHLLQSRGRDALSGIKRLTTRKYQVLPTRRRHIIHERGLQFSCENTAQGIRKLLSRLARYQLARIIKNRAHVMPERRQSRYPAKEIEKAGPQAQSGDPSRTRLAGKTSYPHISAWDHGRLLRRLSFTKGTIPSLAF